VSRGFLRVARPVVAMYAESFNLFLPTARTYSGVESDDREWCPVTGRGFGKLDVHNINSSVEAPLSVCSFDCAILGEAIKCREKDNCPESEETVHSVLDQ